MPTAATSRPATPADRRHEAIAVAVHNRFVTRQFELHRDANRLVATIAE